MNDHLKIQDQRGEDVNTLESHQLNKRLQKKIVVDCSGENELLSPINAGELGGLGVNDYLTEYGLMPDKKNLSPS